MQQGVHLLAVVVVQFVARQLDQVSAQRVLVAVHLLFLFPHFLGQVGVPPVGQAHGLEDAGTGHFRHLGGDRTGLLHRHRGGIQQTLVQQCELFFLFIVGDGQAGQTLQQPGKGQQQGSGPQIEGGVHHRDAPRGR